MSVVWQGRSFLRKTMKSDQISEIRDYSPEGYPNTADALKRQVKKLLEELSEPADRCERFLEDDLDL